MMMAYQVDPGSRQRGVLAYAMLIGVSVLLGLLIRAGVITNQLPW